MKNRVFALFLAMLIGISATACGSGGSEKTVPTVTVSGVLPERGDLIVTTTYMGDVTPKASVTVYPMVSGNVTEMNVTLDKPVRQGEVLFNVDSTDAAQALEEAEKELAAVKKQADQARKEAETAQKESETAKKEAESAKKQTEAEKIKTLEETVKTKKTDMDSKKEKWDDLEEEVDELEEQLDDVEEGKITMSDSKKEDLEEKIEDKNRERRTARTAYETAKEAYEKALKDLDNAKKNAATTTTTTTTTTTITSNSASNTTSTVTTLYDEQVAAAEKKVNDAKAQLSMYQVKAPFDGVVEAIYIDKNQKVFEDSACVVISNNSDMEVTFQVPESIANSLHTGEKVKVEKDGGMNEAIITEVAKMADPDTKLFPIKASLGAVEGFSNGTSVKVHADTKKSLNVMKIPYDALYFQGGSAYVYCIEDDEAVRREVQVGLMNDESAEILEGLAEDDVVISTWSSQLKDGAEVNLLFVIGYDEEEEREDAAEDFLNGSDTPEGEFNTDGTVNGATEEEYKWVLPGLD